MTTVDRSVRVEAPAHVTWDHDHVHEIHESANIRIWEAPVRITHWTIVITIAVLSITGFYIGTPVVSSGSGMAFLMGKVRFVHYVAGWMLGCAVVARILWMFLGNHWARWKEFIPVESKRRKLIPGMVGYYLLIKRKPPNVIGHNPLAGMAYTLVFLLLLMQTISGIAMDTLAQPVHGWLWALTGGWLFKVAPIPMVRLLHHLTMYVLLAFATHHVYLVFLADREHKGGVMSSMVSGYKRVKLPLHD